MEINSQLIIERLSLRMDLDRIYFFKYQCLNQEHHHLLLALKPVSGLSTKALRPIVELCLMDQENITYEIVLIGDLKSKIKIGSIYYAYASLPKHIIFLADGRNNKLQGHKELRSALELTDEYYKKILPLSADFLKGAESFAKAGNYLKAVFMLHQGLENHLKLLQIMVEGKVNNVHRLNNRIRNLSEHFATLDAHFIGDNELARERFKLLDGAFDAVKQNKDLEISAFDASCLYDHSRLMLDAIEQLFHYFIGAFRVEYEQVTATEINIPQAEIEPTVTTVTKAPEIKKKAEIPPVGQKAVTTDQMAVSSAPIFQSFPWPERYQSDIQQLLDKIYRDNQPEQIMLLNYYVSNANGSGLFDFPPKDIGSATLYLVVIKKRIGSTHFRKVSFGRVTAVISFLNTSFIETKLNKGSRFSNTIWNDSIVLFRDPNYKPCYFVKPIAWSDTLLKAANCCERNSKLMQDLVQLFIDERISSRLLAVSLLNQLLSIGLYSYLYLRIGHAPNNANLEELIEWTCICDSRLKEFFVPKNNIDGVLNAEIIRQTKSRIYELPPELAQLDMSIFSAKASDIGNIFLDLCQQSLKYMEAKSGIK